MNAVVYAIYTWVALYIEVPLERKWINCVTLRLNLSQWEGRHIEAAKVSQTTMQRIWFWLVIMHLWGHNYIIYTLEELLTDMNDGCEDVDLIFILASIVQIHGSAIYDTSVPLWPTAALINHQNSACEHTAFEFSMWAHSIQIQHVSTRTAFEFSSWAYNIQHVSTQHSNSSCEHTAS